MADPKEAVSTERYEDCASEGRGMHSASQILHRALGPTSVPGCTLLLANATCWLCGCLWHSAMPRADWMGAAFTGQNRVRCPTSPWVCEPCVYFCQRTAPVPGHPAAPGKTAGGNFRNYSQLWDEVTGYAAVAKNEKPRVHAFLHADHAASWFCGVADSGQKHLLPWIPVNPAGCRAPRVLFEERELVLPPSESESWQLPEACTALLSAGVTKAAVERGDYSPHAWALCPQGIRTFESEWARYRGGAWFDLALWLAQRAKDPAC